MKKILIAGNWKMNLNVSEASLLVRRLQERIQIHRDIEVVLIPSMLDLQPISLQIDRRKFKLAAQNAYHKDSGAYTGEVSFTMLRDLVHYCLIGHSERRHIFHESLEEIQDKIAAAYRNGITPILCVGETKTERINKETNQVLEDQMSSALANITSSEIENLVIAYEPVWAIGTGEVATPDQAKEAVKIIRNCVTSMFGHETSQSVRVLYGGSVTPDVSKAFLKTDGIDGLLVGGASLNYMQFSGIVDAAFEVHHSVENK
jgi:triosephosphate isomerase (TIM)